MLRLFLAFSDLTCHLEDTGIGLFWFHCASYSKETEFGSSNQEASPSPSKNTRIVVCHVAHGSVPLQLFLLVRIFLRFLGVICYNRWVLSKGYEKLLQGLVFHELTDYLSVFSHWIMAILSKGCTPDNFESHNSLKLSFTNICGLPSKFVECKSFLESNFPDILALSETNLNDSIDSGNFSVRGYLLLIWKDYISHRYGLAVYAKEGLPFTWDLSLKNSAVSFLFSNGFTSLSVLLLFPLSITFFLFMHGFWFYFI